MDNYMLQRRYVGNNETAAYVAQDFADSFPSANTATGSSGMS